MYTAGKRLIRHGQRPDSGGEPGARFCGAEGAQERGAGATVGVGGGAGWKEGGGGFVVVVTGWGWEVEGGLFDVRASVAVGVGDGGAVAVG